VKGRDLAGRIAEDVDDHVAGSAGSLTGTDFDDCRFGPDYIGALSARAIGRPGGSRSGLAGGGALLRGFDKLLSEETGLPVHVAEDPLSAVAEGTGKCLNELKFLRQVAAADRQWR